MSTHPQVRAARDFLLLHRSDYETAYAGFSWPELQFFNFATDWFDGLAEDTPDQTALWVIDAAEDGAVGREQKLTFAAIRDRSIAAPAGWPTTSASGAATGSCWCWATACRCGRSCSPRCGSVR